MINVKKFATLTSPGFAFDCYRRLIQMFGDVVYHIPKELFDQQKSAWNKSSTKNYRFSRRRSFCLDCPLPRSFEQHQVVFPQDPVAQLLKQSKLFLIHGIINVRWFIETYIILHMI